MDDPKMDDPKIPTTINMPLSLRNQLREDARQKAAKTGGSESFSAEAVENIVTGMECKRLHNVPGAVSVPGSGPAVA